MRAKGGQEKMWELKRNEDFSKGTEMNEKQEVENNFHDYPVRNQKGEDGQCRMVFHQKMEGQRKIVALPLERSGLGKIVWAIKIYNLLNL